MGHQRHLVRCFFSGSLVHKIDDRGWDREEEAGRVGLPDSRIVSGRGLVHRFGEGFLGVGRRPVFEAAARQRNVQHCCVQSGSYAVVDHARIGGVAPILRCLEADDQCHVALQMSSDELLRKLLEGGARRNALGLEQGRRIEEYYKCSVTTSMHNLNRS